MYERQTHKKKTKKQIMQDGVQSWGMERGHDIGPDLNL